MSSWVIFYITLLRWNFCWNGTVSFKTFVESDISCCVPRLPLILTVKFHSLYVKESQILETRSRESEILESRSRIFYLRLRNPASKFNWQTLNTVYRDTWVMQHYDKATWWRPLFVAPRELLRGPQGGAEGLGPVWETLVYIMRQGFERNDKFTTDMTNTKTFQETWKSCVENKHFTNPTTVCTNWHRNDVD